MKVKITNARGAFLEVIEAVQYQGAGAFYWGGTLLCGPKTEAIIGGTTAWGPARDVINQAIGKVAVEKWGAKAKTHLTNILPDMKACCWVDGNRREYDGFEGNWALSVKRYVDKGRPQLLDRDKSPILKPDGQPYPGKEGRIYSGAHYNASVEIWAQDNKYGKGIRCELLGLQFFRDGDAFGGGGVPSEDDFESIDAPDTADDLA